MAAIDEFLWKLVEAGRLWGWYTRLPKGIIMFYFINVAYTPLKTKMVGRWFISF